MLKIEKFVTICSNCTIGMISCVQNNTNLPTRLENQFVFFSGIDSLMPHINVL